MEKKKIIKKKKKKIDQVSLWATIVSLIAVFGLICVVIGLVVIIIMLKNKPTLNIKDFNSQESSVVYDKNGDEIADLGSTIRENISYDQLPNYVVDAFVAVEDSRFFEHNGFDVPRFTKAMIENIKSLSFAQGGSTFTMQLVKNTYFTDDETGQEASRSGLSGVARKTQEIALALETEKVKSKKSILEDYINKLNFGGSGNIRGIQKAAEYYFGKSVEELNLSESAMLAGVINAPTLYNPFNYLDEATSRRDEVLYLMNYHGYISDQEYELAKSIKVEDLLVDPSKQSGVANPYQAYIDVVVEEINELTGLDPYETTMHIYTYMDPEVQTLMDQIQAGEVNDYFEYPDEWYEIASICVDNKTSQIIGVLGGRNYSEGGALLLNHATDQYKQPGSTIKPILDYALAFENLGWSTDHVLTDKPIYYGHEDIVVQNFSGTYVGDVTIKTAVGDSINTCAIQTLQAVIQSKGNSGESYVVDYLQSLGYDVDLDDFDIQFGIGGAELTVTCEQMAGAYAAIMNYGKYTEPHCIERIEFTNGKSPITPTYESKQVLSEAASYITSDLLRNNVANFYGTYSVVRDTYPVYAKTGTTDWSTVGVEYGIPVGANKDAWLVSATSDFTIATWTGYEKASKDHQSYITNEVYNQRLQGKIADLILDKTVEIYGTPTTLTKPEGVTSITHIVGTYPYASVIEGMDEEFITTGLVKSEYAKIVSPTPANVEDIKDASIDVKADKDVISLSWSEYPDEDKLEVAEDTKDTSLKKSGEVVVASTGKVLFDYSWVYGPIQYKADIKITHLDGTTDSKSVADNDNHKDVEMDIRAGDKISVNLYYGYEKTAVNSNVITKQSEVASIVKGVTIPSSFDSEDEIKSWANKNSITLNGSISYDYPTKDHNLNSITVRNTGSSGASIDVDAKTKYSIIYFAKDIETCSDKSTKVDESVELSASIVNGTGTLSWTCGDEDATITPASGNSVSFKASSPGTYNVEVSDKEYSKTIVVKVKAKES